MTITARNAKCEEHFGLIEQVMQRCYRLIRSCRLCPDDVRQDLSIKLLEALDTYDPEVGPTLETYLKLQLGYAVRNMVVPSKLYGVHKAPREKPFQVLSLDSTDAAGRTMQIPSMDDHPACIWIQDEIASLPDAQRAAITDLLYGKRVHCDNKALHKARKHIRERMDEVGLTMLPVWKECVSIA